MAAVTSAVAAVGGLAVSAYGASSSAKAANRSANAQEAASAAQADLIDSQRAMAEEQWANYKSTHLPLEKQVAEEAQNAGNVSSLNKSAQDAAASVSANFQQARQQLQTTPGIDPTSQQYLKEANKLNMQEAASTAAAENNARAVTTQQANALKTDVASLGKGAAAGASSSLGSAMSAQGGMVTASTNQANAAQGNLNASLGGFGMALGTTAGVLNKYYGNNTTTSTVGSGGYGINANYALNSASNYNAGGMGISYKLTD